MNAALFHNFDTEGLKEVVECLESLEIFIDKDAHEGFEGPESLEGLEGYNSLEGSDGYLYVFEESLEDLQDLVRRDCRSSTLATISLTHSCLVDLIDMTLADEHGYMLLASDGLTRAILICSKDG